MSMVIANNIPAVNTKRQFATSARGLSGAMEKLSSGYKINTGKDDPAGLVISEQLRSQLNGLKRAQQNTEEAINVLGIAEGALNEMNNILKKMKALAIHSANNGITSPEQVAADQAEMDSAIQTLDRIAQTTKFSDQYMLNGQKDITYEQNTLTKGTQQNSLVNARESEVVQIFKRDGFSVALNFTGTTNPNNLTGTGDTDFSQQAMKPYLEIDTARGSSTAQVDKDGNFTQQQQFTLTGTKGSRTFKFKQGSSVADMVQQVHSSADSTGVDAALIFNSAQRIDKLGNGNGEFTPMVENKFRLDGLVDENGESLYLSVSYDEKDKDKVNLDAFDPGLDFQVTMNNQLDAYGMPTYNVTLGGKTLMNGWDGKADTFNRAMASLTANNTNAGDEFAHLKYMNIRVDTDIDPRESFKGDGIFRFATTGPLTGLTVSPVIDDGAVPAPTPMAGSQLGINFSGMDPTLFVGGAANFKAETREDSEYLHLSVIVDGIEHTAEISLEDLYTPAGATTFAIGGATAAGEVGINVADSIFNGLKITTQATRDPYDPDVHSVTTADDVEVTADDTRVELNPAAVLPSTMTTLRKSNLDNIPENPGTVNKPIPPRQTVDMPVDPATIYPGPNPPAAPIDGNAATPVRPTGIAAVNNYITGTGLLATDGSAINFNLSGITGNDDQRQAYLNDLKEALGSETVQLVFKANGDGTNMGEQSWTVEAIVGTGGNAKTFELSKTWNGTSALSYSGADTSALGEALKNVQFTPTSPVDRGVSIAGDVTIDDITFPSPVDVVTDGSLFATGGGNLSVDFSGLSPTQKTNLLTAINTGPNSAAIKSFIANGGVPHISVTAAGAGGTAAGTLAVNLMFGTETIPLGTRTLGTNTGTGYGETDVPLTAGAYTDVKITYSGVDAGAVAGAAQTKTSPSGGLGNVFTTKWSNNTTQATPKQSASSAANALNPVAANISAQATWDANDAKYKTERAQWIKDTDQYNKDMAAYNNAVSGYPDALRAYEADQFRYAQEMKVYNAQMKDYNVYRERVLKFEAGNNVVKNGLPLGTDLVPDPGAVVGGVAIGDEAESVARNVGTVAVFNNELDPDGSGKVIRGVQGVAMSDEAADSIHYGKNTDGQGRVFVKFLDDNSFELYKDASLSAESLVATGINGREIKEANNSGLKGLTLNLAKDAGGDLPAVKGVYIALAGIEGRSTNVDKDGNAYDGVIYDKDVVNTPRTVEKIATQEDVDAALLEDPTSTLKVGDKFKTQTYEGGGCFDADRTLITGVELGRNTSEEGKIYLKNMYDAKTGTMQVFAYKNDKMRDEDMVAKSEIYKVVGDDGTDAKSITVVLNEVRLPDKTEGTGLGIVLSVDAAAFKGVESSTLTGAMQFTNLGARVFAQDYGSGSVLKITQDKGAIFSYYQSPGVDTSKRVIAAGDKATTVELKGQDATLSINGAQVFTDGLKLNMANQDLQANFVFNKGKVGSTTLAQVGYDDGSIFTKAGALNVGSAEANEDGISGQLCNAGHTTNEKLDSFQGGMQMQLGEGSGDQNRTVVAIKSLTADNLGRVSKSGYWDTGSAVYTEKMFTMKDVMGGGFACLRTDPVLAMSIIEVAINDVAEVRAQIGAMQANLLQTNSNNLSVTMENIQKTESGIRDADMADEMTEFTKNQVLQSAATSMLANANQSSQNVLQLLQ